MNCCSYRLFPARKTGIVHWKRLLHNLKYKNAESRIRMKKLANYLWVEKNGEEYTLIMTPELQDDIGTVGFVEFTKAEEVVKNDSLLELEASKTVLDLASPLAGKIVAVNERATDEPTLLNSAKADESWVVKLTGVDEAEFNALADA